MGSELYLRYRNGELSREAFLEEKVKIGEMLTALKVQMEKLERQEKIIDKEADSVNQSIKEILKWESSHKLDRELAECLIKKINVYPKQHVEIVFNYRRNELFYGGEAHE